MKKTLNIKNNALIASECWTHYKFAIMQTSEMFDLWLLNHMNIFFNSNCQITFGEQGKMFSLSYYEDLLEISEANITKIDKQEIVSFILNEIEYNNYIILDLNFHKILNIEPHKFHLHEALIYGYDIGEDIFLSSIIKGGQFREIKIPFKQLEESFEDVVNYYNQDLLRRYYRRSWFLGITILKLKDTYKPINPYFDFLTKIETEINSFVFTRQIQVDDNEQITLKSDYVYYTGLSIISRVRIYMPMRIIPLFWMKR